MNKWRDISRGSWTFTRKLIVGFGGGVGEYRTSYAIHDADIMLNGMISADFKLSDRHSTGAGLICRANEQWTFLAFYTAPGASSDETTVARLGLFKDGEFSQIFAHPEPISLSKSFNRFTLEFYSGDLRCEIRTGDKIYEIETKCPQIPFPGYVGLVKFYGAAVQVKDVAIEATEMPFGQNVGKDMDEFDFNVFICHSGVDKPAVMQIAQAFKMHGIAYWLDSDQIDYGDSVIQKIEDGLQRSRCIMPVVSKNLVRSGWTRAEFGAILNSEFSGSSRRIVVPLKLEDCEDDDIPLLLRDKKRVAYGNRTEFAEFCKFLKR